MERIPGDDIYLIDFGGNIGAYGKLSNVCACFDNSNEENIKRVFRTVEKRLADNARCLESQTYYSVVEDPTQATDDVPATEEPTEATEPSQEPTEPEDPTEDTKEPEDPTEDTKDPEDPTEATDDVPADTVPENILWDEEGVYYWGETEDGKPHGQGICLIDGYYYIGQFDQGQRDGTFLIVAAQDPEKTLTLTWEDGQIDPEDSHLEEYAVRTKTLKVYTKADKKAEVLTELKKDDVVYKTHTQAVVAGAQKWIQVICGDTIGWVPMDSLIPKAK